MKAGRILVVDDDKSIVDLVSLALRHSGCQVFTARDGAEALRICAEHSPDVVVLDFNLPGMDGGEVCRRLKEYRAMPVVAITGAAVSEDEARRCFPGADSYMVKPFDIIILLARLRVLLEHNLVPSS
jgi:DNA-binding response OmpR family regulator